MPELFRVDLLKLVRVRHPHVSGSSSPRQGSDTPCARSTRARSNASCRKPWNDSDLRTIMHFAFEVVRLEREKRACSRWCATSAPRVCSTGRRRTPVGIESELLLLARTSCTGLDGHTDPHQGCRRTPALEHLQADSLRLCSMLSEIKVWLPGVTAVHLGAIARSLPSC